MISKWKINLIAFLISLTLFSVGFSSWQITNTVTHTEEGVIQVDSVGSSLGTTDSGSLVQYVDFELFTFDEDGFVSSTGDSVTKTTVSAYFYLLVSEPGLESDLQRYFSNADSLYFEVTFTPYSNQTAGTVHETLLDGCTFAQSASYTKLNSADLSTPSQEGVTTSFSPENGAYKIGVKLDEVLASDFTINDTTVYDVTLRVDFTFDVGENYAAFYNAITTATDFQFGVSAIVSGYVSETTN